MVKRSRNTPLRWLSPSPRIPTHNYEIRQTVKEKKIPLILVLFVCFGAFLSWQGSMPLMEQRRASVYYPEGGLDVNLLHALASGKSGKKEAQFNPLGLPQGVAEALPNTHDVNAVVDGRREADYYGGRGDSSHVGGFFMGMDLVALSPFVWKNMVRTYNVKSVLDLGCGRGFTTSWFDTHGVRTLGVDGSHDARRHSAIPKPRRSKVFLEHDYARGPW